MCSYPKNCGNKLFKTVGVVFEKGGDEICKKPLMFSSNDPGNKKPKVKLLNKKKTKAVVLRKRKNSSRGFILCSFIFFLYMYVIFVIKTGVTCKKKVITDDSDDHMDDLREEDFFTDSEVEVESDHEAEKIVWPKPQTWKKDVKKHPKLKKFGEAKWTAVKKRGSLKDIKTQSPRAETFHIKPTGCTPLVDMFLDALDMDFWNNVVSQTKLYAKQKHAFETGRGWHEEKCTVSNFCQNM